MFTGALLAIVLGSALVVDGFHEYEDEQGQAFVVARELEEDGAELRVATDSLLNGAPLDEVQVEIDEELADLDATGNTLRELSDVALLSAFPSYLRAVDSALRAQLASVRAGQLEVAERIAEQRTEPALDVLEARAEATHDYFMIAAERSARASYLGLWISTLFAGLAIAGLSWRHERARRSSQAALEQRLQERAEEVEAITERHRQLEAMKYTFVSAVSHELRTPLTAIHGSLEMLEDGDVGRLPPAAERLVSVAARGTRRLSRLVEDVIDLERLESGHFGFNPAPHDLHALLLDTVESLAPLTERAGIELVLHDMPARMQVLCDEDRILQALVNLVGNAIKFTSPGGAIHLEAICRDGEAEVAVRDEGRGIPAEHLAAVFERFHQVDSKTDQAKGGAGLGLTITRHIIEAQGGRIWVESEYGTGTAFRFTLPLTLPETPHLEVLAQRAIP